MGASYAEKDMVGRIFGYLTVKGVSSPYIAANGHKHKRWFCECVCGKTVSVRTSDLMRGIRKSCGCHGQCIKQQKTQNSIIPGTISKRLNEQKKKSDENDITGQIFGKLTAIRRTDESKYNSEVWEFECECGNKCYKPVRYIRSSSSLKSCGCDSKRGRTDALWVFCLQKYGRDALRGHITVALNGDRSDVREENVMIIDESAYRSLVRDRLMGLGEVTRAAANAYELRVKANRLQKKLDSA